VASVLHIRYECWYVACYHSFVTVTWTRRRRWPGRPIWMCPSL